MKHIPTLSLSIVFMATVILAPPALAGPNLLTNPGFEDGGGSFSGWTIFDNAFISDAASDNIFRTGLASGKAFGQFSGSVNASGFFQAFVVMPNRIYEFSGHSYVSSDDPIPGTDTCTENRALARVVFRDGGGQEMSGNEIVIGDGNSIQDQWSAFSVSAPAPAGAVLVEAYVVFLQPDFDPGAIFVDDLSLIDMTPPMMPNVLANPSFDTGLTDWNVFGNAFPENRPEVIRTPPQSAKLFGSFTPGADSGVFQTFPATPSSNWQLDVHAMTSCWFDDAITGSNDNEVRARIVFRDSGGIEIGANETILVDNTAPLGTWKQHTVTAIAPDGTVSAEALVIFVSPSLLGGSAYIDDLSFQQAGPVPVTFTSWGRLKQQYE